MQSILLVQKVCDSLNTLVFVSLNINFTVQSYLTDIIFVIGASPFIPSLFYRVKCFYQKLPKKLEDLGSTGH